MELATWVNINRLGSFIFPNKSGECSKHYHIVRCKCIYNTCIYIIIYTYTLLYPHGCLMRIYIYIIYLPILSNLLLIHHVSVKLHEVCLGSRSPDICRSLGWDIFRCERWLQPLRMPFLRGARSKGVKMGTGDTEQGCFCDGKGQSRNNDFCICCFDIDSKGWKKLSTILIWYSIKLCNGMHILKTIQHLWMNHEILIFCCFDRCLDSQFIHKIGVSLIVLALLPIFRCQVRVKVCIVWKHPCFG